MESLRLFGCRVATGRNSFDPRSRRHSRPPGRSRRPRSRFKTLTALSQRRDSQLDEAATEMVADTADTPEQTVLHTDCNEQLRSCIAQMSREHREVIDLVYYHDKSVEEVAEIIHLPKNTVKTRMFYARKGLARLLSTHRDFDHLHVAQAA
jgi:RNA polymerase sigma factor (sigma-70 family)